MSIYNEIAPWYDKLFPVGKSQGDFFRDLFTETNTRKVLDAGCGTGRHLEIFTGFGVTVAGLEPEADMVAAARSRLGRLGLNQKDAPVHEAGLEEAGACFEGTFDAVVCLGNTLAHLGKNNLSQGLAALAARLRPGGILVTQTVNFDAVLRQRRQPFSDIEIDDPNRGKLTFRRNYDFAEAPAKLGFELSLEGKGLRLAETLVLTPYRIAEQEAALRIAGLECRRRCGDWSGANWTETAAATIIVSRG
jgi:SAM-dependent methyltransferase